MIYLTPEGGLCNRMRSMASLQLLAERSGQTLRVDWWRTDDMNCSFGELFQTAQLPFQVRELNAVGARGPWVKAAMRVGERLRALAGQGVLDTAASAKLVDQEAALRQWAGRGHPRIRTNSKLIDAPGLYARFKPAPALQAVIDGYATRLRRSVAVHIRRSDNLKAADFSPTARFIELMHEARAADPEVLFFIATDSPETYAELQAIFGAAVYEHAKTTLERNDPRAIHDAVVDLYCLAGCQRLLGSYWSSFTDTAWEIHGIDHIIVREKSAATALQS